MKNTSLHTLNMQTCVFKYPPQCRMDILPCKAALNGCSLY